MAFKTDRIRLYTITADEFGDELCKDVPYSEALSQLLSFGFHASKAIDLLERTNRSEHGKVFHWGMVISVETASTTPQTYGPGWPD